MEHLKDVKRASDYASKNDETSVWSELGHAQLRSFGLVADAIASYLKASDSSNYIEVGGRLGKGSIIGEGGLLES